MQFYSAMKKNETLSFVSKWMELENIILSEVNQVQKAKSHMFALYVEYKPNTNTNNTVKTDHTIGRSHEIEG
jgi:hypothetical protein